MPARHCCSHRRVRRLSEGIMPRLVSWRPKVNICMVQHNIADASTAAVSYPRTNSCQH